MADTQPPLALTLGEPAGIGPELAVLAWRHRTALGLAPFFIIGDTQFLEQTAQAVAPDVAVIQIKTPADVAEHFPKGLPALHQPLTGTVAPGKPSADTAGAVVASIDTAIDLALKGQAAGVVTNPIQKSILWQAGFEFPGHTEYLAHRLSAGGKIATPVMMLAVPGLRVVPVTIHVPLKDVASKLTTKAIVDTGRITAQALHTRFAIDKPKLAVTGLNPHAGEDGRLGTEETTIIQPAINRLLALGIEVSGPLPADTLFHEDARKTYDAVLCMYHDQALIPLKTVDFHGGVNVTLGLPIIRTSPDHGTALDIAGTGRARTDSLVAALKLAAQLSANRAGATGVR